MSRPYPEGAIAVGDCVAPRGIWAATQDAAKAARAIEAFIELDRA